MVSKLLAHLRQQWIGVLALLLVLTSGTAYALEGSNTVFSDDIVNGEVRNPDLASDAVGSGKIADRQVKNADLSIGASSSNTIADGGVQGIDVKNDSLTGADIDEGSLDIDESSLDIPDATVYRGSGVVNQPNGQRRTVLTATGLPAGNYLVTFEVRIYPAQRYECIVGPPGNAYMVRYETTNGGGNAETIESSGVLTIHPGDESMILTCQGYTQDWNAANPELDFIELGDIANGVEG